MECVCRVGTGSQITQGVKGAPVLLRNLPLMRATLPWVPLEPSAADLSPLVAWRTLSLQVSGGDGRGAGGPDSHTQPPTCSDGDQWPIIPGQRPGPLPFLGHR